MPTLYLLGTGAAVSSPHRTTTMLAFSDGDATLVVDCGGDVLQRLKEAGLAVASIRALIVTHEHPDHVSGFPLFMERLWLSHEHDAIPVCGIRPAIDQARRCFEAFDTSGWQGMPEIRWHEVSQEENATVYEDATWHVTAAPVVHAVPTIGLRVEHRPSGHVVAYSCDTEPAESVVRLAREAHILVHEATGAYPGHATAEDAARIAAAAEAARLLLVHLPPDESTLHLDEARTLFAAVEIGEELGAYSF